MNEQNPEKPVDVPIDPGTAEFVQPGAADPPPLAALADDLASLPAHVEPGPVKPSEEAEAVLAFLTAEADAYFKTVGLVENVATEHVHRFVGWLQSSLPRRFPGLTRPPAEEPLAFAGGSNVLLEFNGDSWAAMCNAASGAGYVRQTRAEGADLKTPQAALAAVLKLVRERAKGGAS